MAGYAFPLDLSSGNLKLAEGADLVATHIRQLLLINKFENPMRPEYGTNHPLFEASSANLLSEYRLHLQSQLEKEFSSVANFNVQLELSPQEDGIEISVFWEYLGEEQARIFERI